MNPIAVTSINRHNWFRLISDTSHMDGCKTWHMIQNTTSLFHYSLAHCQTLMHYYDNGKRRPQIYDMMMVKLRNRKCKSHMDRCKAGGLQYNMTI